MRLCRSSANFKWISCINHKLWGLKCVWSHLMKWGHHMGSIPLQIAGHRQRTLVTRPAYIGLIQPSTQRIALLPEASEIKLRETLFNQYIAHNWWWASWYFTWVSDPLTLVSIPGITSPVRTSPTNQKLPSFAGQFKPAHRTPAAYLGVKGMIHRLKSVKIRIIVLRIESAQYLTDWLTLTTFT